MTRADEQLVGRGYAAFSTGDGAHYASTETIVFTVADGQVVDGDVIPGDQSAFDAFWS